MVDAIANQNQPPKLVDRPSGLPKRVALFSEAYNWKEEERVRDSIDKLYQNTNAELWEELVQRQDDPRYCVVAVLPQTGDAMIQPVGAVCARLAYARLVGVFQQHLPADVDGRPIRVALGINNLGEWRKERATKSLYQLQIEVCETALRELSKDERDAQPQKDRARGKIEAEIKKLERTKQPVVLRDSFYSALYTEAIANRVREAVRKGSSEEIKIVR
jgi:hypothetical protein